MSYTKQNHKYKIKIKIGETSLGTLPLIGIGRLFKNSNEFNQNKEDTILLDCNNGGLLIAGKKSKYIDGVICKGMEIEILLDMKAGHLGFILNDIFQGIAYKHKNLKKGIFHLTIVLNDPAKSGISIEVMPFMDEY